MGKMSVFGGRTVVHMPHGPMPRSAVSAGGANGPKTMPVIWLSAVHCSAPPEKSSKRTSCATAARYLKTSGSPANVPETRWSSENVMPLAFAWTSFWLGSTSGTAVVSRRSV